MRNHLDSELSALGSFQFFPWLSNRLLGNTEAFSAPKVAETAEEAKQLVESVFDYVRTTTETYMLFRKRK